MYRYIYIVVGEHPRFCWMNIGPIPMSLQELFLENHRLMLSAREEESGESSARVAQHLSQFWFGTSKWGPFTKSHATPNSGCFMVLIYSYNYSESLDYLHFHYGWGCFIGL